MDENDLTAIPIKPLTRRELEILTLLGEGLTSREIAEKLTLANNSVRWYVQQIHSKLGVNGKRQAVQRAQELGLLASHDQHKTGQVVPANAALMAGSAYPTGTALLTGTVTFLFSDIEGSTPLWEQQPEWMAQALQIHNQVLRQAIEGNSGVVFKFVGDSFQAAFDTAPQALRAAIDGERALQSASRNDFGQLKMRVGV